MARVVKINVKVRQNLKTELVAQRLDAARRLAAQTIVDGITQVVRDLIPHKGGWYDIYREAVVYFSTKDGDLWAASGLWPKDYSAFPADTTLIEFISPIDAIGNALVSYNPWTVDQLPALNGGIQTQAHARPASTSEVDAHRERLLAAKPSILEVLDQAGATLAPGTVPTIQGKVYADVAFMANALEHGLAGLPRTPHWIKALRRTKNDVRQWIAPVQERIQRVVGGLDEFNDKGRQMPSGLENKLGL